jgi:inner membrane protein
VDAVTHVLAGACIARTGLNHKTALATLTFILAAEAPDLDLLARLKGPVPGFVHDRGFTHSFVGVALVSVAVVFFMYLVWRLGGRKGKDLHSTPRWWLLFGFAYLAGLSHILLDFTDNYGVRLCWPFSERWYSWDIVYIADPVVTLLLVGGLLLSVLASLMNEEFGRTSKTLRGRLGAAMALIGVVAIWGIRDHEHRRALHTLEARQYQGAGPVHASAFPLWWNPYLWTGVVETARSITAMRVDSRSQDVDPQVEEQVRYKPEETAAALAAKTSSLGRAYMDWARFPITETEALESGGRGYVVRFKDLRFEFAVRREEYSPWAVVRLNQDFGLADMTFGDSQP